MHDQRYINADQHYGALEGLPNYRREVGTMLMEWLEKLFERDPTSPYVTICGIAFQSLSSTGILR